MKEYMMIFRHETMERSQAPSTEQMQAVLQQWQTWIKEIAANGKYSGTNRLLSEGKSLKPGNSITDGPYAEGKEIVGGYLIVKADSIDEAVELAKSCPNLIYGGSVEVRSVMPIDSDNNSNNFLAEK
jgi:hypothetical protein